MGNDVKFYGKSLGKKIRGRRIEVGFSSQDSLAKRVGVDKSRVSRWETDEEEPGPANRQALCIALNVQDNFFDHNETDTTNSLPAILVTLAALDDSQLRIVLKFIETSFPVSAVGTRTRNG